LEFREPFSRAEEGVVPVEIGVSEKCWREERADRDWGGWNTNLAVARCALGGK
jgi:hypothetical protein